MYSSLMCPLTPALPGAVGDWDECGDKFYAKHQLYTMQWPDINLEHMRCAPSWPGRAHVLQYTLTQSPTL